MNADITKLSEEFLSSLNGPECRAWIATLLVLRSLPAKCRCIRELEERQLEERQLEQRQLEQRNVETAREDEATHLRRSA